MRRWTMAAALALAVAGALPATARGQAAAVDSLALARRYTTWLYDGRADSLAAHAIADTAVGFGTAASFARYTNLIAERAGYETKLLGETWKLRHGECQYWRTAEFSNMDEPLVLRWVLAPDGRIQGLGANPESQSPPVDAETCESDSD